MCNVCLKEFKGWCKSFTRTEALLAILEGLLLFLLFVFLVFLILHFMACTSDKTDDAIYNVENTTEKISSRPHINVFSTSKAIVTSKTPFSLAPITECTWKPSDKTKAHVKYYEYNTTHKEDDTISTDLHDSKNAEGYRAKFINKDKLKHTTDESLIVELGGTTEVTVNIPLEHEDESDFITEDSDGEEAGENYQRCVLALVKVSPPRAITFGCILTVVTEYWTITSASCIEAIEEVDSLDSFVMLEDYGHVRKGRTHVISDVQIHPMYEGVNKSYDLVALKSEDSLMKGSGFTVNLPSLIDYFTTTIGESFTLLGYGPYRSIDTGPRSKRLHKVYVYSVPSRQCPLAQESWSLRHLWGGGAVTSRARCGAGPLCAGALFQRGSPCNYCAGSPLLRGSVLMGIMTENRQCGVACEPQLYVNIAALRDWLDFVTGTK